MIGQCRQPHRWLGRWFLRNMNKRHSLLADAGFWPVQIFEQHDKGWICAVGAKSS
jgi:hypothetical protein